MRTHDQHWQSEALRCSEKDAVYVDGKVNGVATPMLVDTGSAVTIIHRNLWDRVKKGMYGGADTLTQPSAPVVAANGQPLQALGTSNVKISLAGREMAQTVLVTEDISHDCLLEADFLASHGSIIDLKNGRLHVGEKATGLRQQRETGAATRQKNGVPRLRKGDNHHTRKRGEAALGYGSPAGNGMRVCWGTGAQRRNRSKAPDLGCQADRDSRQPGRPGAGSQSVGGTSNTVPRSQAWELLSGGSPRREVH